MLLVGEDEETRCMGRRVLLEKKNYYFKYIGGKGNTLFPDTLTPTPHHALLLEFPPPDTYSPSCFIT
jgi:hypothetical protein